MIVPPIQSESVRLPRYRRELVITALSLVVTGIVTGVVVMLLLLELVRQLAGGEVGLAARSVILDVAIVVLVYGNFVYQLARWGRYRRLSAATGPERDPSARTLASQTHPGPLTILVPSYREDLEVVRQTALSAALQDYPDRRVVILVDDPPNPINDESREALAAVRDLPDEIHRLLAHPAAVLTDAAAYFDDRLARRTPLSREELKSEGVRAARLHTRAADWLERRGRSEGANDHTGRLFVDLTFTRRAARCREHGQDLLAAARAGALTISDLTVEYHRLAAMFAVEVTTFERKRYVNLSHEPNKAMNLNAYIGLLGGSWQTVRQADGLRLVPAVNDSGRAVLEVPESKWLLTVDADSLLTYDYAQRLVEEMDRPEHVRTAVMQTPYSAIPDATRPVERTAGATTDIMHLVHQGSSHFNAAYWVGANALLRVAALADIASTVVERGHRVARFIHDRTVIEDTESTIDLVDAGWRLHNYPARLAYSATPADYGALLIQRRRWANGGLIILPKLLRSYRRTGLRHRVGEALVRVHYLISIATVNVALLVLMTIPVSRSVPLALLAATCVPYFLLYARDLRLIGRRRRDLLEVYALNLLLVPVNLGGVLKSVHQAITGRRIPFGRTPKVQGRTAAPALYVAVTLALLIQWTLGVVVDATSGRDTRAVMGAVNAAFLAFAITRYIGWRSVLADLVSPVRTRLRLARRSPVLARTSVAPARALDPLTDEQNPVDRARVLAVPRRRVEG